MESSATLRRQQKDNLNTVNNSRAEVLRPSLQITKYSAGFYCHIHYFVASHMVWHRQIF